MKARFLPAAEAELQHAMLRYEKEREGLGDDFQDAIAAVVRDIESQPFTFAIYEGTRRAGKLRRALVKRFPYVIIFDVRDDEILIVAVSHGHQRPGYWKNR